MISSQNTGKYTSKRWHVDRFRADREIDNFLPAEQSFLGMDGVLEGAEGKLDQLDRTLRMHTVSVSYYTDTEEEYDWRTKPEVSG